MSSTSDTLPAAAMIDTSATVLSEADAMTAKEPKSLTQSLTATAAPDQEDNVSGFSQVKEDALSAAAEKQLESAAWSLRNKRYHNKKDNKSRPRTAKKSAEMCTERSRALLRRSAERKTAAKAAEETLRSARLGQDLRATETTEGNLVDFDGSGGQAFVEAELVDDSNEAEVPDPVALVEAKPLALVSRRGTVLLLAGILLLVATVAIIIGVLVPRDNQSAGDRPKEEAIEVVPSYAPTLERVSKAGILRCSRKKFYFDEFLDHFKLSSFPEDAFPHIANNKATLNMCKALAAGILGPSYKVEMSDLEDDEAVEALANRTIDVAISGPLITVGSDVAGTQNSDISLAFSAPYAYVSWYFYGIPEYVQCAHDGLKYTGNCSGIKFCALTGATGVDGAWDFNTPIPKRLFALFSTPVDAMLAFSNGTCNVFYLWDFAALEDALGVFFAFLGYKGELVKGPHPGGRDEFAMVTLDEEPEWSNFVSTILLGLLAAEQLDVSRQSATSFMEIDAFGDKYRKMLVNAVAAIGNYAEFYAASYELAYPRFGSDIVKINQLNRGNYGLMTSRVFGPQLFGLLEDDEGLLPLAAGGRLEFISNRGQLRCAFKGNRPGFAVYNPNSTHVSRLSGIDIDFCLALSAALFFDDSGASVAWVEVQEEVDAYNLLASAEVDVVTGVTWTLATQNKESTTGVGYSFSQPYFFGPVGNESLGSFPENLCLATASDDTTWSSFVSATVEAIIAAAELDIKAESANEMVETTAFGTGFQRMFKDSIDAVGNYMEVYQRNLQSILPLSGRNQLARLDIAGPLHYVPPGFSKKFKK